MEMSSGPGAFTFPNSNHQPSSPPATPGTQSRYPSASSQISPSAFKRHPIYQFSSAQSPPLDNIVPKGHEHAFSYIRRQQDESSRPSTASGVQESDSSSEESQSSREPTPEVESVSEASERRASVTRSADEAGIQIEEVLESDVHIRNLKVLRPDNFEDAESDKAASEKAEKDIVNGIKKLQCDNSSDEDEQLRRYRAKKKRWSAGLFKRSHSQSVGSDSDMEDADALDAHDVGSSARRLRRRTRGPDDLPIPHRSSLIFEEHPNNNVVFEEPEDSDAGGNRPPSLASDIDDGFTLMPFWALEDRMVVDEMASSDASSVA